MGSALVRCNGNLRQVIRYDATINMSEKNDQARARVADMHVDLRHGSTEDPEQRGTVGTSPRGSGRESRHSFTSCPCSEKSHLDGRSFLGSQQSLRRQSRSVSCLLMDGEEAYTTAALKLRLLLQQLEQGEIPNVSDMKKSISYAADVLSNLVPIGDNEEKVEDEETKELQKEREQHVRAWISSSFVKNDVGYESRITPIERFRAVANTIIIGQFFGSLYREASFTRPKYPRGLEELFQEQLDNWDFDIFRAEALSDKQPLRYVGQELFSRHDLFRRCNISCQHLDAFLMKIEAGYSCHDNPYHNATHAADVTATIHYFIHSLGLKPYLTHLEVLAILLSAIIHDVHHPGTTNAFQIAQRSDYAMLYNDRSVLENHHLYYTFMLIRDDESNILNGLTLEEYAQVRKMMVDMVLATDMSTHFDQIKQLKHILSAQDAASQLLGADRPKLFNFLVHMADISHPGKPWEQHTEWTDRLSKEFFLQGDEERRLGRKCSPLCDRYDSNIPESQHGFIQFIVGPSYDVCGDTLEMVLSSPPPSLPPSTKTMVVKHIKGSSSSGSASEEEGGEEETCAEAGEPSTVVGPRQIRVWAEHLTENRRKWKLESAKKEHEESKQKENKKETESSNVLAPVVNRTKLKEVEQSKVQPVCNKNSTVNGHDSDLSDSSDHTDIINSADNVNKGNCKHCDTNDSTFEKTEYHNAQNKLEERHTISTVQTVQIPGGSEVRTVQTVELRKITTNGTAEQHQPTNLQNRNREE